VMMVERGDEKGWLSRRKTRGLKEARGPSPARSQLLVAREGGGGRSHEKAGLRMTRHF
jgi:hypothetical protein